MYLHYVSKILGVFSNIMGRVSIKRLSLFCYFINMEKNSNNSKQQYFSSNTNDDGKSSCVKLDWICCRMILEGFPVVKKRSARTKNLMLKWREGSRKLRGTRGSTQKNDSFPINLLRPVVPPVTSIRGLLKNRKLKRRRIPAFN